LGSDLTKATASVSGELQSSSPMLPAHGLNCFKSLPVFLTNQVRLRIEPT
jgi:hypothetical protein